VDLLKAANDAVAAAKALGASHVAASSYRDREVGVDFRDGKVEKVSEATTFGLSLELFVEGRYAVVATSDLRHEALSAFLSDAVAMTRLLSPDPFRALPDPRLYVPQATLDLELEDPSYESLTGVRRRELAAEAEASARKTGGDRVISVTTGVSDSQIESCRVHSNGFEGRTRQTAFWISAEVSLQDPDGRRPEESDARGARFRADLPTAVDVGRAAAERALGRIGSGKAPSGTMPIVVDARVAGRLVRLLMAPMSGAALQQKQSFVDGKVGEQITSARLSLLDEPLIPRGLGSRRYDSEGIAARPMPVIEAGVLKNVYVDCYYARKLGVAPTTRSSSNLVLGLGDRDAAAMVADAGRGLFVTGFLGGNSNATTGDFSLGVQGLLIEGGKVGRPVGEMNISGNHLQLWPRLREVGNDPYRWSSLQTPTMLFDDVQVAGA